MSDAYHHGDLRRALLDAAAAVVEAEGVQALSLRDLARRVGVSATAPYHHFTGKADLVCALSQDALTDLDAALAAADGRPGTPAERLCAQGVAYVRFAVDRPERFRAAFRPELGDPFADLAEGVALEEMPAFRRLMATVREVESDPERQTALALSCWAMVHGLAALLVDGPLRPMAGHSDRVQAMAEVAVARIDLGR